MFFVCTPRYTLLRKAHEATENASKRFSHPEGVSNPGFGLNLRFPKGKVQDDAGLNHHCILIVSLEKDLRTAKTEDASRHRKICQEEHIFGKHETTLAEDKMDQIQKQRARHDSLYKAGSRAHILSDDVLVNYVTKWRMHEAFRRLENVAGDRITVDTPILFMCAGEGGEASMLCDMGFRDVTVSDLSERGVEAAISRDSRLKGLVLNAMAADVRDGEYGIVVVQDGLHHLPSPIQGFTEMMRMASVAVVFLEPHDSLVGKLIGTKWEQNGEAINFVFRWSRKLVNDITCSYLCTEKFKNLSFSFWHHNIVFRKLGGRIGGGKIGIGVISAVKVILDVAFGRFGNQFCGLIVLDSK